MRKDKAGGVTGPSLHIEWAPGRVHAVDVPSGRRRSAASMGELTSFFGGQKTVLVGLSRQLTFLKVVSLPRAATDDLRRILTIQLGQHFPLPSDQLAFDFYQTTTRLDDGYATLIAAVRAEDLRLLNAEMQAAGIRASRVLPVALGAAAVAAHLNRQTALVVETAPGLGRSIDVVAGGIVKLSRTVGEAGDLDREVQRTMAAAGVDDPAVIVAGPEATDGAGRINGAISSPRSALDLLHEAPAFQFELAEQRELERRVRLANHNRMAVLLLISALALVGLVWNQRNGEQAAVTAEVGKRTAKLTKEKSIVSSYTKTEQEGTAMGTTLKAAFNVAQPLADVASVVGDSLPKGAWLTSLSEERGKIVQIRGTATDPDAVARFLKNLTDTGRFRDVKLVVANSGRISSQSIVQFNVSAFPIGNLPMPAPVVKRAGAIRATPTPAPEAKS